MPVRVEFVCARVARQEPVNLVKTFIALWRAAQANFLWLQCGIAGSLGV